MDDAVERAAIDDQIAHDRKRAGAPGLDGKLVAVFEAAHVQLTGGGAADRSVGHTVNHHAARAADALTAIVVEGDRLFALARELFVDHIEHFEK